MLIRRQSESMVNRPRKNSAQSIFFWNFTRCQVPSRVRAWFHDSAGDIDFYQMSLSQLESIILHESIIYILILAILVAVLYLNIHSRR